MSQQFCGRLTGRGPGGAWVFLPVPFDVQAVFGTKARVAVRGTLNGVPYRNWLLPNGDGSHSMPVNKKLLAEAHLSAGDAVEVDMSLDTEARQVEVPEDLQDALNASGDMEDVFNALAYSYRKEFVEWITGAKRPDTRARRVERTLELLRSGQRLKS